MAKFGSTRLRLAVVAILVASAIFTPAHSAELAKFKTIYSSNITGSFALTGNSNQTCSTLLGDSKDNCSSARNFQAPLDLLNNDAHVMRNHEIPVGSIGQNAIFNSSANEISIPRNSQVIKAFLFWFGTLEVPAAADFGIAPNDKSKADQVIFAGPTQDCLPVSECLVTGSQETESLGVGVSGYYASFADVTDRVIEQQSAWRTSGNVESGKYSVANVQSAQGKGTSAGWSLVVVYANSEELLQHVELQSGLALIAPRSGQNFEFTNFESPLTGNVNSSIGLIGIDGDAGTVGDSLTVRSTESTLVSDVTNDANNIMNSSISTDGFRSPYLNGQTVGQSKNTFGIEADRFALTNAVDNSSNKVRLNLSTTTDTFYVPAIALATELGKSELKVTKYISSVIQGGLGSNVAVTAGDTLEYTIRIESVGKDSATNISLIDVFPTKNLESVQTTTAGCTVVSVTLSCPNLGNLSPLDPAISISATAVVKVGKGQFGNFATATFGGNQGDSIAHSNLVTAEYQVVSLDLGLQLNFLQPIVQAGAKAKLEARITNFGPINDESPSLRLTMPTGLSLISVLPDGCELSLQKLICNSEGLGIAAGASLSPGQTTVLKLNFKSGSGKSKYRVAGLAITGAPDGDANPENNFDSAVLQINHPPVAARINFVGKQNGPAVPKLITDYISDPDLDALRVKIQSLPTTVGRLVLRGSTLKFLPAKRWSGEYQTRYSVTDGKGGSATSYIHISVSPDGSVDPHHCRGLVRTGC